MRDGVVGRELPRAVGVTAARGDDHVAGCGTARSAFRDVQIEVAIVLDQLRGLHADAFHANVWRYGPRIEHSARRSLHGQSVGVEFGHAAAGHVEIAPSVLRDVRRIDGADPEIDGIAPRAFGVVRMDDVEFAARRKIDVEMVLVLAEVRRPYDAMKAVKGRGDRTPVDQVRRAPDDQPGSIIEAGVGEIKVAAYAQGACVGVVSSQNRVAIGRRASLSMAKRAPEVSARAAERVAEFETKRRRVSIAGPVYIPFSRRRSAAISVPRGRLSPPISYRRNAEGKSA